MSRVVDSGLISPPSADSGALGMGSPLSRPKSGPAPLTDADMTKDKNAPFKDQVHPAPTRDRAADQAATTLKFRNLTQWRPFDFPNAIHWILNFKIHYHTEAKITRGEGLTSDVLKFADQLTCVNTFWPGLDTAGPWLLDLRLPTLR